MLVPLEVPQTEVDHGFADDVPDYSEYWPDKVGHAGDPSWFDQSKEEVAEEMADVRRREEARRRLGGFGFGGSHT